MANGRRVGLKVLDRRLDDLRDIPCCVHVRSPLAVARGNVQSGARGKLVQTSPLAKGARLGSRLAEPATSMVGTADYASPIRPTPITVVRAPPSHHPRHTQQPRPLRI